MTRTGKDCMIAVVAKAMTESLYQESESLVTVVGFELLAVCEQIYMTLAYC